MKKNIGIVIETILLLVAIVGTFSVPADNLPMSQWMTVLIITKVVALAALVALAQLEKRESL